MNHEKETKFINKLFTEVWTKLDVNKIPDFYHQDVVLQMGKQTAYYQDIQHRLEYVKEHYQEVNNDIQDVLVDGDKIIVRLQQDYVPKNSTKHNSFVIMAIYQMQDGKIIKAWGCIDPNVNYFDK